MILLQKTYSEPPFCEREILRYAGCKEPDSSVSALLEQCLKEIAGHLTYQVCYRELPVKISDDVCDFMLFRLRSGQLAANLRGCETVLVFAATLGVEIDRFLTRYSRISPARALIFQAIGAERIEALCDMFCTDMAKEYAVGLKPRFSPGYGDLSLACQKEIFAVLDCERKIGLTLTDSLLMSPSKSVTAFVGIGGEET